VGQRAWARLLVLAARLALAVSLVLGGGACDALWMSEHEFEWNYGRDLGELAKTHGACVGV